MGMERITDEAQSDGYPIGVFLVTCGLNPLVWLFVLMGGYYKLIFAVPFIIIFYVFFWIPLRRAMKEEPKRKGKRK